MTQLSEQQFQQLVEEAVAAIPPRFAKALDNVAFMVAQEPTSAQLHKGGLLHGDNTLLGLYEGIPLPERNSGYSMVLPDVITIFQQPHQAIASNLVDLRQQLHDTVWHEVAHYFGLDHGAINRLEDS